MTDPNKPLFHIGQSLKHVKTGGIYIVTMLPAQGVIEQTGEAAYSYTNGTKTFHRSQSAMEDGRFEPYVAPTHPIAH